MLQLIRAPVFSEDLGIVREVTGRKRGRVYAYDEYLTLLNADT